MLLAWRGMQGGMACGYRLGDFFRSFASIAMRPNSMPILPGHEAARSLALDCGPSSVPAVEHYVLKRGRTVYILVVDDSQFTTALVQFALKQEGYEVEVTDNPRGAMQMIQKREPDLLILDIAMPYQSGFEFTARLRAEGYDIPLIFMTAQDSMESKLKGFHIGADDYICKPFDHQELVARVHAVLRRIKRSKRNEGHSIRVGPIELFPAELQVVINDRVKVSLTRTEMQVLRVLMSCPDQVVSRDQLLSSVWNDNENNSNIVDVYIGRLRKKLEPDAAHPRHIISVRRIGYKFVSK